VTRAPQRQEIFHPLTNFFLKSGAITLILASDAQRTCQWPPSGYATTVRVLFGVTGGFEAADAERETAMIANRMGHQPQTLVRKSWLGLRPQRSFAVLRRAYQLLIDRESPLSSTGRRI
jgi:hypothetical protein